MKVSLNWLRDYVGWSLPTEELAHRLTMAGDEIESIQRIGGDWADIRVAEVIRIDPHPNADRLVLATVDLGDRQQTIVTGAPNLEVGQRVPFAPVGAQLLDGYSGEPITLRPIKIRGIESAGMVCSAKELGLGDDHSGILVLSPTSRVGDLLADLLGNTIFDLKTTPNRPDLLSMLGVAWEVSAISGQPVQPPPLDYPQNDPAISDRFTVQIDDPDLCGRYSAALVRGVTIGESPAWLQDRLLAAGMRPINNVVDVTNYVMLEFGQPMHAFDATTIARDTVIVRRARLGEQLTTLDGVDRPLDPSMLVIADPERAIAIAGVMGGLATEVTEGTRDILLESANFHNYTIRRTATRLRMRSEASLRFEKGISPDLTVPALQRACRLLIEVAGGEVATGLIDEYPGRVAGEPRILREADVERILGVRWPLDRIESVFRSLGAQTSRHDDALGITPPYWRRDLNLTEDLVEEVARIIGYDELPATQLTGPIPATPADPVLVTSDFLRDLMVAAGLQEVITYPLVGRDFLSRAGQAPEPIALLNPMSADQAVLRTSIRPSILKTMADNVRRQQDGLAIFEVGLIYLPREDDLPDERPLLAAALCGPRGRLSWLDSPGPYDFFDGKGIIETIGRQLRLNLEVARSDDPFYHPGRAAEVQRDGTTIGTLGEVSAEVRQAFDLDERVVYFELEVHKLVNQSIPVYQPISRFPDVVQDVALVVDEAVEAERLGEVLAGGRFVQEVRLFDVYRGVPLEPGRKSLAFSLRFRAPDRTLTEDEVSRIRSGLVERLRRQFGAALRG